MLFQILENHQVVLIFLNWSHVLIKASFPVAFLKDPFISDLISCLF